MQQSSSTWLFCPGSWRCRAGRRSYSNSSWKCVIRAPPSSLRQSSIFWSSDMGWTQDWLFFKNPGGRNRMQRLPDKHKQLWERARKLLAEYKSVWTRTRMDPCIIKYAQTFHSVKPTCFGCKNKKFSIIDLGSLGHLPACKVIYAFLGIYKNKWQY